MRRLYPCLVVVLLVLLGCNGEDLAPAPQPEAAPAASAVPGTSAVASEEEVRLLRVEGELARRDAEVSGMAWYGDRLVLLPQHPRRFSRCGGDGCLFALGRNALRRALDGGASSLRPDGITLLSDGVEQQLPGFEGYEAVVFDRDRAYLAIEARTAEGMRGYLVRGHMADGGRRLVLDAATLTSLPTQVDIYNISYEALLWHGSRLLALYEANGVNVNPFARAYAFDERLRPVDTLRVPALEYRITDATRPDSEGRFWVVNYFYPGDEAWLDPAYDSVSAHHGQGETHRSAQTVERLVPLRWTDAGLSAEDRAPVLLRLLDEGSRNWEGIVRFEERGFLLVTDTYPETLLAFAPLRADTVGDTPTAEAGLP